MKNQIIYFITLLLFTGCVTGRQINEGAYQKVFNNEVVYTLIIQPNNLFTYRWSTGMSWGKETGVYEKRNRSIILRGGTSPTEKLRIFESSRKDSDSTYIEMLDFNNTPIYKGVVVINDTGILTDFDGKITVQKHEDVKIIEAKYMSLDVKYHVQKKESNFFVIKLDAEIKDQAYFKDVKVKIRHDKLIMRDPRLSTSMILKKINYVQDK